MLRYPINLYCLILIGGCTRSPIQLPMTITTDFRQDDAGWSRQGAEPALFRDQASQAIQLRPGKPTEYCIWKIIDIRGTHAKKILLTAEARSDSAASLELQVTCKSGDDNRPTYGVLTNESEKSSLTQTWETYEFAASVPPETKEIVLSISGLGAGAADAKSSSVDIRSVEYRIE